MKILISKLIVLSFLISSTCFSQWRVIDTNSDVDEFVGITFADSLNGWALGDKAILHTSDGGETWVYQKEIDSHIFAQILFLDNKVGFVFSKGILRTIDGGNNWNFHNAFFENYFTKASFCNDSTGLMIAAKEENERISKFVLKTYDRGLSWDTLLVKNDIIRFSDIEFVDSSTGYIMGSVGLDNFSPIYIYKTHDGGINWDSISVFDGAHTLVLSAANKDTLWAGWFGFAKSFDGGFTWDTNYEIINGNPPYYGEPRFYDFYQVNGKVGYAATAIRKETANFHLCYTEDGGTGWTILDIPAEFKPRSVSSNGKYIFSGGLDGKILTNKASTVGIENETDLDLPFELYENYPNPFNLSTTITFYLNQPSFINLEIYNILGIKIKTLLKEYRNRGLHKVIWDGRDGNNNTVSSGIYIVRISNNINSKINKSLLIK
ncbi:MAG: YCF48-related protein [Ignavibacteria bacterium]|jgi:hypothetical protein